MPRHINLRDGPDADQKLIVLRAKYEPYVNALAEYLLVSLPPWLPAADASDDWQTNVSRATPRPRRLFDMRTNASRISFLYAVLLPYGAKRTYKVPCCRRLKSAGSTMKVSCCRRLKAYQAKILEKK